MPTYDYICEDCHYSFEYFQSMSSEPLTECPKCKGAVKRKIGAGLSPIFKGSGFYQTDYKAPPVGSATTAKKTEADTAKPADSGSTPPPAASTTATGSGNPS
jgi:putative FmdB family regulatory protein